MQTGARLHHRGFFGALQCTPAPKKKPRSPAQEEGRPPHRRARITARTRAHVNIQLLHKAPSGAIISRSASSERRLPPPWRRRILARTSEPRSRRLRPLAPRYPPSSMTDAVPDFPTCERDSRARDGRRRSGEERPSRHADGHGRDRGRALEPPSRPQSRQSEMGESRPLRDLERSRLDAALRAAASHRVRPADRGAEAFSPAALENARTSGIRPDARSRDDDGPARPGPRQRRRHGDRRTPARRANSTGPATRSSTIARIASSATAA